jgi:hypothetical protein
MKMILKLRASWHASRSSWYFGRRQVARSVAHRLQYAQLMSRVGGVS